MHFPVSITKIMLIIYSLSLTEMSEDGLRTILSRHGSKLPIIGMEQKRAQMFLSPDSKEEKDHSLREELESIARCLSTIVYSLRAVVYKTFSIKNF